MPELDPALEVELLDQPLELAAVRPLVRVQRRPVHLEPRVETVVEREPQRPQDRSRAPSPASSGRARPRAGRSARRSLAAHGNSSRSMPWPIARTFGESSGNERRSTLSTTLRDALGEPERPARVPVRVPEQHRDAERPGERRREHRVDRAHVRDDGDRPRPPDAARRRAPGRSGARARPASARRSSARGSSPAARPASARSASTTTSSTRAASARIFGTVAASAGWPGSTCCVTKTIAHPRRSRRRRA